MLCGVTQTINIFFGLVASANIAFVCLSFACLCLSFPLHLRAASDANLNRVLCFSLSQPLYQHLPLPSLNIWGSWSARMQK